MGGKHSNDREQWVVRTPKGMKDRLSDAAKRQGTDRNALAIRAFERTLGIQHEDDELPASAHGCKHPKGKQRVFAYGTFCGEVGCGARIR